MRIYPYKLGSKSAKVLAEALGCKRVRRDSDKFSNRYNHVIINWGSAAYPRWWKDWMRIINTPGAVNTASNKLLAFKKMKDKVRIPEFTTDWQEANKWADGGSTIVERMYLRAHSGKGIRIIPPDLEAGHHGFNREAPLFVKYMKKADEYRVHVFKGKMIDVQQKRKRHEVDNEDVDYKVRNLAGGWVFCREGVEAPADVVAQAKAAVEALELDFGAVDVGYNKAKGEAHVYEVNTSPGLEGTTLDSYVNAIKNLAEV